MYCNICDILVVTMYVFTTTSQQRGKTYQCTMIGQAYREDGKAKRRVIANISHCSPEEIAAIRLALKHRNNLAVLGNVKDELKTQQGVSVGAVWLSHELARRLGIVQALGTSKKAKLCLWQVIARLLGQGSRLSAVRFARTTAACAVVGLDGFTEDHLYDSLDWLDENQKRIENHLWRKGGKGKGNSQLFLYDVTSSYLEGQCNELGDYGYNRDKKSGKKQIVIGLLTNGEGSPVSVEVFRGNTQDVTTFASQVHKVAERFGIREVVFVGDRGMIKTAQIEQIRQMGEGLFHYITALTKPQIEALIKKGTFQLELFDETVCEIEGDEVRYVLRRNPQRAEEIAATRQSKKSSLQLFVRKRNEYLAEHPRAKVVTAKRKAQAKAERLKIDSWIRTVTEGRSLRLEVDEVALAECARLDGCYVIVTDLHPESATAQTIHDRYKDLAEVEWAFRTMKTVLLEVRPIWVRTEAHTRAHVFVVMLAYTIARELRFHWAQLDCTVEEGLVELGRLCTQHITIKEAEWDQVPTPSADQQELLRAASVTIPEALPHRPGNVVTRKKLQTERTRCSKETT